MEKNDTVVHYVVAKDKDDVNVTLVMAVVQTYVQCNEVYYQYDQQFWNGTIIFGIVGYPHEHEKLQNILGDTLESLGCSLHVTLTKKGK